MTGTCPSCGLSTDADSNAPAVPQQLHASTGCYARYGELLARDYSDAGYRHVHQLTVDAYTAQHPGGTAPRAVQAVALALMTMCLFLEDGMPLTRGPLLHKQMVASRPAFTWLEPPVLTGLTTVADVLRATSADEHDLLVRHWAGDVWTAWSAHHQTIRRWNVAALA